MTRPEIELYMYSLNQEFPASRGHESFLKRRSETYAERSGKLLAIEQIAAEVYRPAADDWGAEWVHNQWMENYTKTAGRSLARAADPMASLIMRREDFGGIAFDPISDRVYKVNEAGYALLEEIQTSHREKALHAFRSKQFKSEEIEHFIHFLKGAGLWPMYNDGEPS